MNAEAGVTLGVIENRDGTRSAAYGGLKTCGSVWCCPVCAAKVATRRADDLATVMRAVDELGGSAFLLTLTMRHDRGDRLGLTSEQRSRRNRLEERLADVQVAKANAWDVDEHQAEADTIELDSIKTHEGCWDVLSYAWQRVTSGSSWQACHTHARTPGQSRSPAAPHAGDTSASSPLPHPRPDEVVTSLGLGYLRRHDLRHTGLTWMADAGVPVHHLRKIAGHGSLSTTQRYLHPDYDAVLGAGELLTNYLRGSHSGPKLRAV